MPQDGEGYVKAKEGGDHCGKRDDPDEDPPDQIDDGLGGDGLE